MFEGLLLTPTLRLVQVLGHGGMGSLWVADHLALHTQVCVKFLDAGLARSADFVRRFHTEAIAAAAIKSPHVAQVFDHGITADGEPYIVMELLHGEDLRMRLRRGGPLPPAELAPILSQVAKALTMAHQVGIVHRDIKPANVFLMKHGDDELFVKVLDFGIAKLAGDGAASQHTSTGTLMGTAHYMSPEQLVGGTVDYRADLWALGIVAYKALTGAVPFNGATIGAVSIAVNAGTFTLPSEARPGLPPAVDAWMLRALARDPAVRFASAREMAQAFEQALHDRGSAGYASFAGSAPKPPIADVTPSTGVAREALEAKGAPEPRGRSSEVPSRTEPGAALATTTYGEPRPTRRRAPLAVGAALLVLAAGLYAVRAATTGEAQSSEPARVAPAAAGLAPPSTTPSTTAAAPSPSATSAPAIGIDLDDVPSTTPTVGRRPAARPVARPAARPAARPKASAEVLPKASAPAPAEAPPPAPPPEAPPEPAAAPDSDPQGGNAPAHGGCARCGGS
jgi:serine/threonine-protein kinase